MSSQGTLQITIIDPQDVFPITLTPLKNDRREARRGEKRRGAIAKINRETRYSRSGCRFSIRIFERAGPVMRTLSIRAAACRPPGYLEDRFCSLSARKGRAGRPRPTEIDVGVKRFAPPLVARHSLSLSLPSTPSVAPRASFRVAVVNYGLFLGPARPAPPPAKEQRKRGPSA